MTEPMNEDDELDILALDTDRCRMVRCVRVTPRLVESWIFVPVEDLITGERYEPRVDHLRLVSDMEALAWVSK